MSISVKWIIQRLIMNYKNAGCLFLLTVGILACTDITDELQTNSLLTSGTFIDSRDNHEYKWITIGNQTWMAENLAYKAPKGAWTYLDNNDNASKYGYLYNFETAQNVCPDGWHLPSKKEWEELKTYIEENASPDKSRKDLKKEPAKPIKSKEEWIGEDANGIDEYNFNALPAGYRRSNGTFAGKGKVSTLWTSTEDKKDKSIVVELKISHDYAIFDHFRAYGFAVRCMKDN